MMAGAGNSSSSDDIWVALVFAVLAAAWAQRLELVLIGTPLLADRLLAHRIGELPAGVIVGLVVSLVLAIGPIRRAIFNSLHNEQIKRRWKSAAEAAGAVNQHRHTPRVYEVKRVPVGERLLVSVPRGLSAHDLEKRAETLAAALAVREVRIERSPNNAAFASVTLITRDSLGQTEPLTWPWWNATLTSLWRPIPVGVDENGQPAWLALPERNILIGGEPGAGKSAALSQLIAAAALDPTVKLWLLDGKMVELAAWAQVAERSAGVDPEHALDVLRLLQDEMDERYLALLDRGLRKVTEADRLPLHVVACDELAFYLNLSNRKQRTEFSELMRDLVSRGRAAGIIVLAATQKPSSDVIPTSLRDLFGFRWAMRCNTSQASDTILGSGWATLGYNAAQIPGASRGVGYLLSEGGRPRLLRSYYLDDWTIRRIAARAQDLRTVAQGVQDDG
jgi:hypothetical protein